MSRTESLVRKSFYVNPRSVRRAQRALRAPTEAEAVRQAIDRVTEMEAFWRFMAHSRRSVPPGSFTGS